MTNVKVPQPSREDAVIGLPDAAITASDAVVSIDRDTRFHRPADTIRWRADRVVPAPSWPAPSWPVPTLATALRRGLLCRCPACGRSDLFRGYLRVVDACGACGAPLGLARADDAPPYFTIFIVAHIVVLLMLWTERRWEYSAWMSAAIWLPVTLVLSLALLRPIKGATVGLMLKLGLMKSS